MQVRCRSFAASLILITSLTASSAFAGSAKASFYGNNAPSLLFETNESADTLIRLLDAENNRRITDTVFTEAAQDPSANIRQAAARSMGRVGDEVFLTTLTNLAKDPNEWVRRDAYYALGQTPTVDANAVRSILNTAVNSEPEGPARAALLLAIGRKGNDADLRTLEVNLHSRVVELRTAAAEANGTLFSRDPGTWSISESVLLKLADQSTRMGPEAITAAFALSRFKGTWTDRTKTAVVQAFQRGREPEAGAYLERALAKVQTLDARHALLNATRLEPQGIRIEALRGLTNYLAFTATNQPGQPQGQTDAQRTAEIEQQLLFALRDRSAAVQVQALQSLVKVTNPNTTIIAEIKSRTTSLQPQFLRETALETLATLAPSEARSVALQELQTSGSALQKASLAALGAVKHNDDLALLTTYAANSDKLLAETALEALSQYDPTLYDQNIVNAVGQALAGGDMVVTYFAATIAKQGHMTQLAPDLALAYDLFPLEDQFDAKVAILEALQVVGTNAELTLVDKALRDQNKAVVQAAADAYLAISGIDVSARVPARSGVHAVTPSLDELRRTSRAVVELRTSKGMIVMAMSEDAPLTAYNFVKLAESGFYNGLNFHRVVPNFVAQGGDPRGDGWGGPGYMIRDEFNIQPHERGSVGMASSGKDTVGCQFFINQAPNLHLDGNYTVFAHVVRGMDVADALTMGDTIFSAQVRYQ